MRTTLSPWSLAPGRRAVSEVGGQKLSCFPLGASFVRSHLIHHVVGHRNSNSFTVLLNTLSYVCTSRNCCIYTSRLFCRSLSTYLCRGATTSIGHVLTLTIRCNVFGTTLFNGCTVLASTRVRQRCLFDAGHQGSSTVSAHCYLISSSRDSSSTTPATTKEIPSTGKDIPSTTRDTTFGPRGTASNACDATRRDASRRDGRGPLLRDSPKAKNARNTSIPSTRKRCLQGVRRLRPPRSNASHGLSKLLFGLGRFRVPPRRRCTVVLGDGFNTVNRPL